MATTCHWSPLYPFIFWKEWLAFFPIYVISFLVIISSLRLLFILEFLFLHCISFQAILFTYKNYFTFLNYILLSTLFKLLNYIPLQWKKWYKLSNSLYYIFLLKLNWTHTISYVTQVPNLLHRSTLDHNFRKSNRCICLSSTYFLKWGEKCWIMLRCLKNALFVHGKEKFFVVLCSFYKIEKV